MASRRKRASKSARASTRRTAPASRSPRPASWIQTGELKGLERATLEAYRQHFDLHIEPYLGSVKLSQLTAPMVREFEEKLAAGACRRREPNRDRPRWSARSASSLSSLITDAQERGLVSRNVVRDLRRPGAVDRAPGRETPERQAQDRRRHSDAGRDQGHRRGCARALAAVSLDGDLYRFASLRTSRPALGGRRPRQARVARAPARGSIQEDRQPEIRIGRTHRAVHADRREHAAGMEAGLPEERARPRLPLDGRDSRTPFQHRQAWPCAGADRCGRHGDGEGTGRREMAGQIFGASRLAAFLRVVVHQPPRRRRPELPAKVVQERLGHSSIVMTMDVYGHLFPRGDDSPSWRPRSARFWPSSGRRPSCRNHKGRLGPTHSNGPRASAPVSAIS